MEVGNLESSTMKKNGMNLEARKPGGDLEGGKAERKERGRPESGYRKPEW
jgi:hypothetical protein